VKSFRHLGKALDVVKEFRAGISTPFISMLTWDSNMIRQ